MPPKNGMKPIHPGAVLADELEELGLPAENLDKLLALPCGTVAAIASSQKSIDADIALRLSRYLGSGERLWMNLQVSYDLKIAQETSGAAIAKQVQPRTHSAPIFKGDLQ